MAKKDTKTATAAAPDKAPAPQRFTVAKLRENCRQLFGVSSSTFDGATNGMTGTYTVEEIKVHIEKWVKEGVK